MSHRLKKYKNLHPWSFTNGAKTGKCWKSPIFEGKLGVFISYLNQMKTVSMLYNSSYSSTFYSLFLPSFSSDILLPFPNSNGLNKRDIKKLLSHVVFDRLRGLAESIKKGKFATKIVFQIMLNKVLESCKNDISLI